MDWMSFFGEVGVWSILTDVMLGLLYVLFLLMPAIIQLFKSDLISDRNKKLFLILMLALPGLGLVAFYYELQNRKREKYSRKAVK